MNRCWKLASLAAGLVAGLTGCSDDSSDAERRIVLRGLADEVVLPALDEAAARSAAMATAIDAVVSAPDQATLDAAQAAWRAARAPWKQTAAFGFGPAADERLGVAIDQSPVDFTKIDAEIAAATPISDAYIDGLGANRKGFHALEYLLFHYDDDAAVLATLTTDAAAARRRELLGALAHNHARRSGELATAWSASGGGYIT
ncbi:MAG: imelysin family protein, partial [Kofleriaceae bacterium]